VPVQHQQLSLRGDGLTLAAERWEPASRRVGIALLLHGGGQTRHSWQTTCRRLAEHGWAALALDTRGHGESDWAPDADYSIDALVADLRAVLAELDEPPVLIGASMGGMTALIAQGEDPTLGRGLVLVDVTPRIELEGAAEIADFMRSGEGGFASLDEVADAVVAYNPHRERPPRPEGLRKNLRKIEGRWYWHWDPRFLSERHWRGDSAGSADGGDDPDAAEMRDLTARAEAAARAVTVPTLLFRGAHSKIVSESSAGELQRLIPTARRLDVSGAGHMVAGDDNDVFSGGLLDWLERGVLLAN
jgi:pimeloyl-ACP methyl ester carboxylesterase